MGFHWKRRLVTRILKNVMCPEKLNEERNNHCAEKAQMCLSANSSLAVFNPGF